MDITYWIVMIKALHVVGAIAWLGGLFYLGRIFVYHAETFDRAKEEQAVLKPQFALMAGRAYRIICNPAMNVTWFMGLALLYLHGMAWFKVNSWMHIKLLLLIGLTVYQLFCKRMMLQLAQGNMPMSAFNFRLFNEIPTLLLMGIVLLAVMRNMANVGWTFGCILLIGLVMYFFAKRYKRIREQKS